jgi:hypothetical protein
MKKLIFALLVAGCGGDGPNETCTNTVCPTGKLYQLCTSGTSQVRYVLGGTSCACGATSCSDCLTLVSAYCNDPNTNGTNGGTTGGTSGSTNGTTSGTNGGTTGGACKAGGSACQSFDECCSGTCANQVCTQCRDNGSPCTLASQCCSNICHVGSCAACGKVGASCTDSHECCSGVACISGVCGGPDVQCTSQPLMNCVDCCTTDHMAGADVWDRLASTCSCTTCLSTCGLLLCPSPAPAGDATSCQSCLNASCQASVINACMNDATCAPFGACLTACPST